MAELRVTEASLQYTVRGSGPGLLVPVCNFPWLDMPFLDVLAAHFTVVAASPRGYQGSTRLAEAESYTGELLTTDLLAVCDHVGLDTFAVLGYSLTAAMAVWLAGRAPGSSRSSPAASRSWEATNGCNWVPSVTRLR